MPSPVTGVLDNFNRADTATNPPSSSWSTGVFGGTLRGHRVVSNQCAEYNVGAGDYYSWWNVQTFGPDCEAYLTVATKPALFGYVGVGVRATTPGVNTCDGYEIEWRTLSGTDEMYLYRVDNRVYTLLGSAVAREITDGDQLHLRASGTTLEINVNGSSVATRTDSTYTTAGYLYVYTKDTTVRFDDFGGGNLVVSETPTPGGGNAAGTSPTAVATSAAGGGTAAGSSPAAAAGVAAGAAAGGGQGGGASTSSAAGGGTASGTGPSPWVTVGVGGAIVAANVVTGAVVTVTAGGATAGGTQPSAPDAGLIVTTPFDPPTPSLSATSSPTLAGFDPPNPRLEVV